MNKTILLILTMVMIASASAYQWVNQSGTSMNIDFANGGVTEATTNFNATNVIGGSFVPYNATGLTYQIHQGLLYITWSNITIADVDTTVPSVNCTVIHRETEWGEINCSASETVNWSFSIIDNVTNETFRIFDTRQDGFHKFVGLLEGRIYKIEVNATDTTANVATKHEKLVTRLGGERNLAYATLGIIMMGVTFLFALFAFKAKHISLQIGLSLMAMIMVVFDFFMSARIMEAVDSTQTGIISNMDTFYRIAVVFMRFAMWGVLIFILWYITKVIRDKPSRDKAELERIYGE